MGQACLRQPGLGDGYEPEEEGSEGSLYYLPAPPILLPILLPTEKNYGICAYLQCQCVIDNQV